MKSLKSVIIPIIGLFILFIGFALVSAQSLTQQVLVQTALATTDQLCQGTGRDEACYGHSLVSAVTQPDVQAFAFDEIGDIESVVKLQSLRLSDLAVENGTWGITLMKLRANLPTTVVDNVTLLAFGGVEVNAAEMPGSEVAAPMQAFYFQSDVATGSAAEAPSSGLLIQTPEGAGEVTFLMNEVNIQIGSTVYFEAAPEGDMIVSTLEGKARVKALGVEEIAVAGTRVRIPMDANLRPAGPPTPPESYNAEALSKLPLSLMPRQITVHPSGLIDLTNSQMFQPVDDSSDLADAADATDDDMDDDSVVTDGMIDDSLLTGDVVGDVTLDATGNVLPDQFGCGEPGNACNAPGHNKEDDKDASDANNDKVKKDKKEK